MLQVQRVGGQLGIRTTKAQVDIRQPKGEIQLEQKNARMTIHTEHQKVYIDQQQCFNESGLMDPTALMDDLTSRGMQAVSEGIARNVDEGNMMAAIENGGGAIADIAFGNSFDNKEFNMVTMPRSRPQIEVRGGTVDIKVDEGGVTANPRTYSPQIDVRLGDVEIFVKQYPSISFKFTDEKINTKV